MLVLARKVDQKIRIGNNIVITVLKVSGDNVSLGIDAPGDQLILREELAKKTAEINRKSAVTPEETKELPHS
ncbi:MAG: hypothetical protein KR126chlam2_01039 [Chlamydiae bacterium]|nr:hypothetical protein [Chlamydiota bacterium]